MVTWRYVHNYDYMTSLKHVCICHHRQRFQHKSLVLKNKPERRSCVRQNVRGEEEKLAKSVGREFFLLRL